MPPGSHHYRQTDDGTYHVDNRWHHTPEKGSVSYQLPFWVRPTRTTRVSRRMEESLQLLRTKVYTKATWLTDSVLYSFVSSLLYPVKCVKVCQRVCHLLFSQKKGFSGLRGLSATSAHTPNQHEDKGLNILFKPAWIPQRRRNTSTSYWRLTLMCYFGFLW